MKSIVYLNSLSFLSRKSELDGQTGSKYFLGFASQMFYLRDQQDQKTQERICARFIS